MVAKDDLHSWIRALAATYQDHKEDLTQLDAAIGDADHGINMDRGFKAVVAELEKSPPQDIGTLLKTVAMTLIKTVGGAAGPLYGTFFLRAAAVCTDKTELLPADIAELFAAGLEGVLQRGKAQPNDKTMVDALTPAVEAMKQALKNGAGLMQMLDQAAAAAHDGMRRTIPLQARKGRASYLGERSIGHQDPGATSSYLMIKTALETWSK
jgi:phosphoenolpyruvate---glycerone phosphotransferase subunit DhaL